MSRSNPHITNPNPSTRWHQWSGGKGELNYYDKDAKANVEVKLPFTFIVLDILSTIKGWHDASQSGISANEVRSVKDEILTVRSFKGGTIAEGLYSQIKDKVIVEGGKFAANIYIAYKDGAELKIGSLVLSGAAFSAWCEFSKNNRAAIYSKAISITGNVSGKKGSITFKTPTFTVAEISADTDIAAKGLDVELQAYLKSYFGNVNQKRISEPDYMEIPLPEETFHAVQDDGLPF